MEIVLLDRLDPREYEHPFDQRALDNLQKTKGLDLLIRKFYEKGIEKAFKVSFTGSYLQVNDRNFPQLHQLLKEVCRTLYLQQVPTLYLGRYPVFEPVVLGVDQPLIFLSTEAFSELSEAELRFMLGSAVGRIKSNHVLYLEIGYILPELSSSLADATMGLSAFFTLALQMALMHWQQMATLTADRAGMLACQDITVAMEVLMKLAGLPDHHDHELLLDDFMLQARAYEDLDQNWTSRFFKMTAGITQEHPLTMMRANKLMAWMEGPGYTQVIEREALKPPELPMVKFCPHCGHQQTVPAAFCPACGGKLGE